jgi:hypothetical protein
MLEWLKMPLTSAELLLLAILKLIKSPNQRAFSGIEKSAEAEA